MHPLHAFAHDLLALVQLFHLLETQVSLIDLI